MACMAAGCRLPVLTVAYLGSTSFVSQTNVVLNYHFQNISCAISTPLWSNSQSGFSVAAQNKFQSTRLGLLPSSLTHVQSNSGDLPSVTALPDCQSMSRGFSTVLALTSVQSVQCCIPSSEESLLISKYTKSMYSPINERHTLSHHIKKLFVSKSDSVNQLAFCLYPAEFGLLEYIFSENSILVLVVNELCVHSS
jgi:hypothetical protein